MTAVLQDGWWVYADGTRLRAIAGGQDEAIPMVFQNIFETGDPDPGGVLSTVPAPDLPGALEGGVPFGEPGQVSLADVLRSGGSPTMAESVNAGSLSDLLRSGADSPAFDPSQVNVTADASIQSATDPNAPSVMDVVARWLGMAATVAKTTLGGVGSSNPATRNRTSSGPSLWQRVFGTTPTAGGNAPTLGNQLLLIAAVVVLGVLLLRLATRALPARG